MGREQGCELGCCAEDNPPQSTHSPPLCPRAGGPHANSPPPYHPAPRQQTPCTAGRRCTDRERVCVLEAARPPDSTTISPRPPQAWSFAPPPLATAAPRPPDHRLQRSSRHQSAVRCGHAFRATRAPLCNAVGARWPGVLLRFGGSTAGGGRWGGHGVRYIPRLDRSTRCGSGHRADRRHRPKRQTGVARQAVPPTLHTVV